MTSTSSLVKALRLSASAIAVTLISSAAGAVEAEPAAQALKAALARQDINIEWTGAAASGDKVTLQGVRIVPPEPASPVQVGTIVMDDVEEDAGSYYVGTLNVPGFTSVEEDVSVQFTNMTITNLDLSEPDTAATEVVLPYESADIDTIVITASGKERVAIDDFVVETTMPEGDGPLTFKGSADSFRLNLSEIEDAQTRQVIEALNYTELKGSFQMSGNWTASDGRTKLESLEVTVDNAGTLNLSLDMGGYTPALIKSLREAQAKIQAAGENDTSAGMALLGMMQQLTFLGAKITFTDDDLTQRSIDYIATRQNAKPADIVNQAKALLPFLLAQLNNPEFSAQVSAAVSAYLDDPESLTIKAAPTSPVPFAMIAAGAMTAPQMLPQQLGVTVSAND